MSLFMSRLSSLALYLHPTSCQLPAPSLSLSDGGAGRIGFPLPTLVAAKFASSEIFLQPISQAVDSSFSRRRVPFVLVMEGETTRAAGSLPMTAIPSGLRH